MTSGFETPVTIGIPLTIEDIVRVARDNAPVVIDIQARAKIIESRNYVDRLVETHEPVYGINTGFGWLARVSIDPADIRELQRNIVLSHAAGVGEPLTTDVVRTMLLLRAQSLAFGVSGVRIEVIQLILSCLNRGIHPIVPSQGSVGSSGDLAPLAHVALTLIGEGSAELDGEIQPSLQALRRADLHPLTLEAKEGLALINGTQAMTAIGTLLLHDAQQIARAADITGAMSFEALQGSPVAFDARVTAVRAHPGAVTVAENMCRLVANSPILEAHESKARMQDAYSLRCIPQVHGASRDAINHALEILMREANSVTDNPLVFYQDDIVLSAGNFHGQPVALAMDYVKIALSELANIAERRIARLVDPVASGLPAFLAHKPGLNSGLMIVQYTAASLVSENKVLAHPSSVDSIPTSANQEDHVSMGTTGARQARTILHNVEWVVGIEALCATEALEFHKPLNPGPAVSAARDFIRTLIPPVLKDRFLQDDLRNAKAMIASVAFSKAVEEAIGPLL